MEKLSKTTILQALNAHKAELKQFGVKKIALFGSFLHDSAGKQSDIDIYVELESPSFDTYFDLKFFLEKLLGRKVDLVTKAALKPALADIAAEALYAET
ncbi:nucleotidyltransferase family protein [Candidatus Woesearchaeota archaeon]|nr:MAG: hypothetical protein QS99_C0008G0055 [archaeon GW2011_AR4]MBS3129699.1 nucleotidyltransferase family protein [Candidatus Woesearchaeota archaeon]HIH38803.1 nucleotidyltransferase family protein [Candidatus Woesearchaeota archaeon]HIH49218.1 nucleotidyltransferase family protein [Candidatus Woesearchaeota archaeon]HIJ03361.1 nucleotidyltransferase family protein [Candidatus Woesearchaeota archaeon]